MLLLAETSREQAEVHRDRGVTAKHCRRSTARTSCSRSCAPAAISPTSTGRRRISRRVHRRRQALGESIEAKDRYTQGHCERVADVACALAAQNGIR
jgi:HD-GYP domain-containing protein (c-di-GMP phosphodiesterase class II)